MKHNPSRRIDMPLEIFNQRQHALRCIDKADPNDPRGICNKASVSWRTTRASHARFTEEPNDSFIHNRFPEVAVTIFAESCETFVDAITRFSYCLCIKAAFHPDELRRGLGGIKVFQEKTRELDLVGRTASSAGIERSFLKSQDGRRVKISVKRAGHGRLKVDQPVTKQGGHAPKNMYVTCLPGAIKPTSPTRISIAHMLDENAMTRSSATLKELAVLFHRDVQVSGRGGTRSGLLSTLKPNMDIENEILLIIKIFLNIFPEALNYPDMPLMQLEADSLTFHEVADAFNFMSVHDLSVVDIFSHGTLMGLLKYTTTA